MRGLSHAHTTGRTQDQVRLGKTDEHCPIAGDYNSSPAAISKSSGSLKSLISGLVAVTRLDKGFLRMPNSIMAIKSEEQIKTHSIYGSSIGFHRYVMLVPVLGTLAKSPTICYVASRKNRFRIDCKLVNKHKYKLIISYY